MLKASGNETMHGFPGKGIQTHAPSSSHESSTRSGAVGSSAAHPQAGGEHRTRPSPKQPGLFSHQGPFLYNGVRRPQ